MKRAAAIGLAIGLLTSCSGDDERDGDAESAQESTTAPTTAPPATTTTTAATAPALGSQQLLQGGTMAAYAYEQPVAQDSPQPSEAGYPSDYEWGGLDVEVCVPSAPDEYAVSNILWSLTYPDHSIVEPSHTGYEGFPQPEYPWGEYTVSPGQCVRGWIVFAVPAGERPNGVSYAASSTPLKWTIN